MRNLFSWRWAFYKPHLFTYVNWNRFIQTTKILLILSIVQQPSVSRKIWIATIWIFAPNLASALCRRLWIKIKCQNKKVVKKHRVSQFVTSFDSSWLRFRRQLWVWISKKIKIYKIGRLRVSNSTFWVLYLSRNFQVNIVCHINIENAVLWIFPVLSRTEKGYCCSLVCLCGVSVLTIYLCLFSPLF